MGSMGFMEPLNLKRKALEVHQFILQIQMMIGTVHFKWSLFKTYKWDAMMQIQYILAFYTYHMTSKQKSLVFSKPGRQELQNEYPHASDGQDGVGGVGDVLEVWVRGHLDAGGPDSGM